MQYIANVCSRSIALSLSQVQVQPQVRFTEPDNRDWRGRSGQLASTGDEKSWETLRDTKESSWRQQEPSQITGQDQFSSKSQVRMQEILFLISYLHFFSYYNFHINWNV